MFSIFFPDSKGSGIKPGTVQSDEGDFYPATGMRAPTPSLQAVHDIQRAQFLGGKIWIDFFTWSGQPETLRVQDEATTDRYKNDAIKQ